MQFDKLNEEMILDMLSTLRAFQLFYSGRVKSYDPMPRS